MLQVIASWMCVCTVRCVDDLGGFRWIVCLMVGYDRWLGLRIRVSVVKVAEEHWTMIVDFHHGMMMVFRGGMLYFGFGRQVSEILVMHGGGLGKRLLRIFIGGV